MKLQVKLQLTLIVAFMFLAHSVYSSWIGYTERNCQGETREYSSLGNLLDDDEFEAKSYSEPNDPSDCHLVSSIETVTVTAAPSDYYWNFFDSTVTQQDARSYSRLPRLDMSEQAWTNMAEDYDDCWREKAAEKDVEVDESRGYNLEVDNSMLAFGKYNPSTRTVTISFESIINGAMRRGVGSKIVGIYSFMHEGTHDDRVVSNRAKLGEENINEEERLTQKEVYTKFYDVWGFYPPYSYRTEEEVEALEEKYADDPDTLNTILRSLKWNDDYDKSKKIERDCRKE